MKIDKIRQMLKNNDKEGLMKLVSGAIIMRQDKRIKEMEHLVGKAILAIENTKNKFKCQELKELKDECVNVLNNHYEKV
jgi:hypothetical protein